MDFECHAIVIDSEVHRGWNVIVQFDRAISSAMVLTSTGLVTW